jgi:hypothetical protein
MYGKKAEHTQRRYAKHRMDIGVYEEDVRIISQGPDSPEGVHHPGFDYALSNIIESAIIDERTNGQRYWVPYVIEQWGNLKEEWTRMEPEELQLAKAQIPRVKKKQIDNVLLMYLGRTKRFDVKRCS